MILCFLAVEAERQIVPGGGKSDRRRRGKGDALVRGSEKLVAADARSNQCLRVELAQAAQARAVVEQSRVEEIRSPAPRLGHEVTKSKHVTCQGELQKGLSEVGHEATNGR
jgi:hypothetical protein